MISKSGRSHLGERRKPCSAILGEDGKQGFPSLMVGRRRGRGKGNRKGLRYGGTVRWAGVSFADQHGAADAAERASESARRGKMKAQQGTVTKVMGGKQWRAFASANADGMASGCVLRTAPRPAAARKRLRRGFFGHAWESQAFPLKPKTGLNGHAASRWLRSAAACAAGRQMWRSP
jgi:hypothetical protein